MLQQQQQDRLQGNRKEEATPKEIPITLYVYGSYPLDVGSCMACWDAAAQSTAFPLFTLLLPKYLTTVVARCWCVCVRSRQTGVLFYLFTICLYTLGALLSSQRYRRQSIGYRQFAGICYWTFFCRLGSPWKREFRGRFFVQRFVCVYFVLFARKGKSTRTGRTSRRQVEGLYDSLMTFDCLLMLAALFVPPFPGLQESIHRVTELDGTKVSSGY